MKCERIKELILSGYSDGELHGHLKETVKEHMERCEDCRMFQEKMQQVSSTFKGSQRIEPPQVVWERINEAIKEREEETLLVRTIEKLRGIFTPRRPALVLTSVVFVACIALVFVNINLYRTRTLNLYLTEQEDFFNSLTNGNGFEDIGIPAEDIFM